MGSVSSLHFTNFDKIFIAEARYYLKSTNEGLFFEVGIPVFFTAERRIYTSEAFTLESRHSYIAANAFGGLGIKYQLTSNLGVEMNATIKSFLDFFDLDYGSAGFIKSGVKLFMNLDKKAGRHQ